MITTLVLPKIYPTDKSGFGMWLFISLYLLTPYFKCNWDYKWKKKY